MMSLPWIIIVFSFLYYAGEMPAGVYWLEVGVAVQRQRVGVHADVVADGN
jgi:hypothetical protein